MNNVFVLFRLENSASNLAGSVQNDGPGAAGSNAPSLLEVWKASVILNRISFINNDIYTCLFLFIMLQTGKAFTAKGMQVLEYVGKETMDLLISETGIEVEKARKEGDEQNDGDQLLEEVTFDRCFYIYGGPEQLEVNILQYRYYYILQNLLEYV